MKKLFTSIGLSLAVFLLSFGSGHAQMLCQANYTKVVNNATKTVTFTNTSSAGNTSFYSYWSFGDGTGSNGTHVTKTYAHPGHYYVCLHIMKADSTCDNTKCDSVFVGTNSSTPCNANWTKTKDNVNNLKYYFNATLNDTNFKYLWTFGDGTSSDNRIPVHTFNHSGKYYVCLKVTKKDSTCTLTSCDSVLIGGSICNPAFIKIPSNLLPKTFIFEASTNDTNFLYRYNFGDGTSNNGRVQTHTYVNNGTYSVCLTVTKKDSSCSVTQCQTLVISAGNPCNANFNFFKSDTPGANPHYIRFTNTSTGTATKFVYNFGDGTMSDNPNPVHYFSTLGSHTVCLTIYNISNHDTLCKSTTCKTFNNGASNTIGCVANFEYARIGTSTTYHFINHSIGSPLLFKWVFDNGAPITTTNVDFNFLTAGYHQACLFVMNALDTNCKSSFCISILCPGSGNQQQCTGDFEITPDPVNPATYHFTSLSGNTVLNAWNFGDGTSSTDAVTTHTYTQNGDYYVCLNVENSGSSDMQCKMISISGATGLKFDEIKLNSVYPVPLENTIHIDLQSKTGLNTNIKLHDISGKIVLDENYPTNKGSNQIEIEVQNLPHGVYLLQIQSGDQQLLRKIIK